VWRSRGQVDRRLSAFIRGQTGLRLLVSSAKANWPRMNADKRPINGVNPFGETREKRRSSSIAYKLASRIAPLFSLSDFARSLAVWNCVRVRLPRFSVPAPHCVCAKDPRRVMSEPERSVATSNQK